MIIEEEMKLYLSIVKDNCPSIHGLEDDKKCCVIKNNKH